MSDRQDEKLEAMLESRRFEPASRDLAERIILKAQAVPQNPALNLIEWIRRSFLEFHLPKPAYVLTGTLILGIVLGLSAPFDTVSEETDAVHVQSFLYVDETIL